MDDTTRTSVLRNRQLSSLIRIGLMHVVKLGLIGLLSVSNGVLAQSPAYQWDPTQVAENTLPPGWVIDATNPSGPLARWRIKIDSTPSGSQPWVVIDQIQDRSPAVFNLCWSRQPTFMNGEIRVRLQANTGQIDQGGGVIWRVQDAKNYYVARYNPLEKNFRLYYVQHGKRTQLASYDVGYQARGSWVNLRVVHDGERIQGWINDAAAWDVLDGTLTHAGGVGLWTKADAATSFSGFEVRPRNAYSKLKG